MMQPLFVTNLAHRPYRPAYRPMPYAPVPARRPAMGSGRRLGVFSPEEVPSSLLIAGIGVGGFLLSNVLPAPWDWVGKGISVVLVGYAGYKLVSAPPPPATPQGSASNVSNVTPIARPSDFESIQASFVSPKMYSTAQFGMFSGKYPVEILVSYPAAVNPADRLLQGPVTFILQLDAKEIPYGYGGHLSAGDVQSGVVGSQQITLNPGEQRQISFNPATITSTWQFATIDNTLTLYKIQSGGTGRTKLASVQFFLK